MPAKATLPPRLLPGMLPVWKYAFIHKEKDHGGKKAQIGRFTGWTTPPNPCPWVSTLLRVTIIQAAIKVPFLAALADMPAHNLHHLQ